MLGYQLDLILEGFSGLNSGSVGAVIQGGSQGCFGEEALAALAALAEAGVAGWRGEFTALLSFIKLLSAFPTWLLSRL